MTSFDPQPPKRSNPVQQRMHVKTESAEPRGFVLRSIDESVFESIMLVSFAVLTVGESEGLASVWMSPRQDESLKTYIVRVRFVSSHYPSKTLLTDLRDVIVFQTQLTRQRYLPKLPCDLSHFPPSVARPPGGNFQRRLAPLERPILRFHQPDF